MLLSFSSSNPGFRLVGSPTSWDMDELAADEDGVECAPGESEQLQVQGPSEHTWHVVDPDSDVYAGTGPVEQQQVDIAEDRQVERPGESGGAGPLQTSTELPQVHRRRWAQAAPVLCTNFVFMAALSVLNLVSSSYLGCNSVAHSHPFAGAHVTCHLPHRSPRRGPLPDSYCHMPTAR